MVCSLKICPNKIILSHHATEETIGAQTMSSYFTRRKFSPLKLNAKKRVAAAKARNNNKAHKTAFAKYVRTRNYI